jgi:hypothetical protein
MMSVLRSKSVFKCVGVVRLAGIRHRAEWLGVGASMDLVEQRINWRIHPAVR